MFIGENLAEPQASASCSRFTPLIESLSAIKDLKSRYPSSSTPLLHPSAPHLPQSVLPNHPEVAEAVAAQLRFAAEEDAAAAASGRSEVYAAPDSPLSQYNRRR